MGGGTLSSRSAALKMKPCNKPMEQTSGSVILGR
jgi:hypothetical protein